MKLCKAFCAEFFGTFWLVFGGCGAAVFAADHIGYAGVALAFGLTVMTMAYAVGHISGGHFNPAVSIGLATAGRFCPCRLIPYFIAQFLGGIAAAAVLYVIYTAGPNGTDLAGFASNGFGEHSPGGFPLCACYIGEAVLTFFFLIVILGSTDERAPQGFAPIAIGLCLTLIILIGIPLTNLSVNPARSLATAVFEKGWALEQVWLFFAAPITGAVVAGLVYRALLAKGKSEE
ncbi:MAG: aquaporin Z [Thermoguttaceae bacterium]|nr:aquaporin Z [Thermoguttaceae bacterium]